ncbi:sulfotransferase [Okeanomitos corallinicola TIOX110]|uniref:Sulfotransferase n=1 Tax=Okeanomitos corallinicola TIOX110 TaxID=3133117 RepID=A0ABZ2UZV9_9CYAN
MKLPNFLLAGFEKCGTTSIYNYLNEHPQIYMSPIKEPNFLERDWDTFTGEKKVRIDTLEKYTNLFAEVNDSHRAIGEASPNLLFHYQSSIPRIQQYVPHAKILVVLRDPVTRAYSDYLMQIRDEITGNNRTLIDQLKYSSTKSYTLKKGLYYTPIKSFLETFGTDNFQVFLYDDLSKDPTKFMQEIYTYLDVDSSFIPNTSKKSQIAEVPRSRAVNQLLKTSNPMRDFIASGLRIIMPLELRQKIRSSLVNLNSQGKSAKSMSEEERYALSQYYYEDVLKLQDLIQRDLSNWTPIKLASMNNS